MKLEEETVKKTISMMLAVLLCVSVFAGCGGKNKEQTGTTTPGTTATDPTATETPGGNRVIFFGDTQISYGQCVLDDEQSTNINDRLNDQGIFYQIGKANGVEFQVTNYSFGGHKLSDFYTGSCAAGRGHDGHNHMNDLDNYNYDYVVLQESAKSVDYDVVNAVTKMKELFAAHNPNVKIIFVPQLIAYTNNYAWAKQLEQLETMGVTVADVGFLQKSMIDGTLKVPGGNQAYNRYSFIISKSAQDGINPNILTGYMTAMMTYCAITGQKAVDLAPLAKTSIVNDATQLSAFRSKCYLSVTETNFDQVLLSETEMQGIRKLIDQVLAK